MSGKLLKSSIIRGSRLSLELAFMLTRDSSGPIVRLAVTGANLDGRKIAPSTANGLDLAILTRAGAALPRFAPISGKRTPSRIRAELVDIAGDSLRDFEDQILSPTSTRIMSTMTIEQIAASLDVDSHDPHGAEMTAEIEIGQDLVATVDLDVDHVASGFRVVRLLYADLGRDVDGRLEAAGLRAGLKPFVEVVADVADLAAAGFYPAAPTIREAAAGVIDGLRQHFSAAVADLLPPVSDVDEVRGVEPDRLLDVCDPIVTAPQS